MLKSRGYGSSLNENRIRNYAGIKNYVGCRSGRQGCNLAGESPGVSVARIGYVESKGTGELY